ncbi:ABC transporter G family member 20 isoform X2 [Folsomia candida]|uniref:ABC transporter G family member 20 isoform X2 n=1 Tax=Folsomia candida TaxID=158441 RepID=UPI0016050EA3|nr:ABC transporter G family member 20 isoform X2 [Folsomia candida]
MAVVQIRNGYKSYNGKEGYVLRNLDMDINRGEIYGLLGASGCGKTTLLSCLVGLRQFDRGRFSLFGRKGGGVTDTLCGYVPQDTALQNFLTAEESLTYYGMIYGLTNQEIENMTNFLTTFLDLKSSRVKISCLSGGQKRRVSIAIAMIHNPKLLIMDEPIVGLGPLLRERIWAYLKEISRTRGTTIIISTHYVNEAKLCDKIGFMRGGRLIAEDNPEALLSSYGSHNLENFALKICLQDELEHEKTRDIFLWKKENDKMQDANSNVIGTTYRKLSSSLESDFCQIQKSGKSRGNHFRIIFALLRKSFYQTSRDLRRVMPDFVIPVMMIGLLQNIIGLPPRTLPVGLVTNMQNVTTTKQLGKFCNQLNSSGSECLENVGICSFIDTFENREFDWVANSYENAIRDIKLGNTIAFLEFPPHFGMHVVNRIIYRNWVDTETLRGSTITVETDNSNTISSTWFKKTLIDKYFTFLQRIMISCSANANISMPAMKFRAIHGSLSLSSYTSFIQPGLIILLIFMLCSAIAILWAMDRSEGLEDRDYVAGVNLWHKIGSSIIERFVITGINSALILGMLCAFYNFEIKGSLGLGVGLIYLTSLVGLSIGWIIGTLGNKVVSNAFRVLGLVLTQAFSAGILTSLDESEPLYRNFCELLPLTKLVEAFRSVCLRGWGISNRHVVEAFLSSLVWILVPTIVAILVERKKRK